MLEKILPDKFYRIISEKVNLKAINEIRIRAEKPVVLIVSGKTFFLSENGVTSNVKNSLISTKIMVEDVIFRASECSIYSVNEQIKRGFIVTDSGIRIGLGGNLIEENGKIKTMTNFSSCNIRIPHNIKNCSLNAFSFLFCNGSFQNTLIVSPPGCGKTTFLRDFVFQLSQKNFLYNVLIIDERGEIDCNLQSDFVDKIAFSNKKIGFENGIRALSPDIIVTDEIGQKEDVETLKYATTCGVKIMATVHCDSIENLRKKDSFKDVFSDKIFQRFVLLSNRNGPGTYEGVYDENFSRIYR